MVYTDEELNEWLYCGEVFNSKPCDGPAVLKNLIQDIKIRCNFKNGKKYGNGILVEKGIEYKVIFDEEGKEITEKRSRTFSAIRLMIGNKKKIFNFFFFFFYFFKIK